MLNKNIRAARNATDKKQKDVAIGVGVSERAYARYESGDRIPNAIIITRIAAYLGTTVEALCEEEAQSTPGDNPADQLTPTA